GYSKRASNWRGGALSPASRPENGRAQGAEMEVDTKNAVALRTQGLTKAFGRLTIVENVDLVLPVGARHAMIGPNGAGKTTIINMLTGQLRPTSGRVMIAGHDVTDEPVHQRVK